VRKAYTERMAVLRKELEVRCAQYRVDWVDVDIAAGVLPCSVSIFGEACETAIVSFLMDVVGQLIDYALVANSVWKKRSPIRNFFFAMRRIHLA
jgi:hypothetical protein